MRRTLPNRVDMERAILARDAAFDGLFFVGVRSTGVFCRPSCPARRPKPENVEFFASVSDCLLAGYRPCKRCRPLAAPGAPPDCLDALLAKVETDPAGRITDAELRAAGAGPHRVRRYFQRNFGMTFQAYHRARRMGLALTALKRGGDALRVGLDHGFDSSSGFRDAFERTFGTPPGRNGELACILTRPLETPIGPMVAGATDEGICLLEYADRRALVRQVEALRQRLGGAVVPGRHPHLDRLAGQLAKYFAGRRTAFDVPLVLPGTPFQQRVWGGLQCLRYGTTCSYAELARRIDEPGAQRAVARANGDNRIAIVIPCHRVVGSDGKLRGYGGGLWRKQFLLDLERSSTPPLDEPGP